MADETKETPVQAGPAAPTPHDAANDGKAPADAANSKTAPNTPAKAAEVAETKIAAAKPTLKASLDNIAKAVEDNKANPDGTVTVDFGKAGKISGCLVLNSVPGADLSQLVGQHVTVVVPISDEDSATISVEARYISR